MVACICIDDSKKPNIIPKSKWIINGDKYHITHVYYHPNQGISGVSLYEKPLDESCQPYETFKLSRFAIDIKDLESLIELIKDCTELDNVDVHALLKESELIIEGETA